MLMQLKKIFLCFGIGAISSLLLSCGQEENTELLGNFKLDVPIVYVKRPLDDIDNGQNPRDAIRYKPGGHLYIREFASPNSREFNITANIPFYPLDPDPNQVNLLAEVLNGNNVERQAGDVATPEVSYDGKRIVFAVKEGDYANRMAAEQPKWDLWEYVIPEDGGIEDGTLQRLISVNTIANKGNDFDPVYLPDGRVVFSSDRVTGKAATVANLEGVDTENDPLQTESAREAAANLHILNPSSQSIEQISFNSSHELNPSVLANGQIVYSRWEQFGGQNFDLFRVNPDGTGNHILYGSHSHNSAVSEAVFFNAKQMQNGLLVANLMPLTDSFSGGDLISIDFVNFADISTPRDNSTSTASSGQAKLTNDRVSRGDGYSMGGRYTTPFPLWDNTNRLLVAWAPCESEDVNGNRILCPFADTSDPTFAAPPAYGIWIFDANTRTQRNIVLPQQGMTITDPVAMVDRFALNNYPDAITDLVPVSELVADNMGLVKIRSVYDTSNLEFVGHNNLQANESLVCNTPCNTAGAVVDVNAMVALDPASRQAPRFARIVRAPVIVGNSPNGAQNMREISGYQQIEPDGSVIMRVPANWPFAIELVDNKGRKIRTNHNNWLQVKAGMTMECVGCHENHSRSTPLYDGAPAGGFTIVGVDGGAPSIATGQTMAEAIVEFDVSDTYEYLDQGLVFDDYWRDPLLQSMPGTDTTDNSVFRFNLGYAMLTDTPAPVQLNNCIQGVCRTVIDYVTHIQPLWERDRSLAGLLPAATPSCVSCHAEREWDSANGIFIDAMHKVPDGQLTLTATGSNASGQGAEIISYVELTDDDVVRVLNVNTMMLVQLEVMDGAGAMVPVPLVDSDIPITLDGNGNVVNDGTPDRDNHIRPNTNNRVDGPFFNKMSSNGGTVDHSAMLEPIEIFMIQEWVDQGARYTSDPTP